MFADEFFDSLNEDGGSQIVVRKRSRALPIIAFGFAGIVLLGASFIWFWNPYPPLKRSIESLFTRKARPVTTAPGSPRAYPPRNASNVVADSARTRRTEAAPMDASATAAPREWEYFVQVSSWTELAKAQRDANLFRSRGMNASTRMATRMQSNPKRKITYFRVRLGPLPTRERAAALRDSLAPSWKGAFIDSARFDPSLAVMQEEQPVVQPAQRGAPDRTAPAPSGSTGPSSGYGVKVSSFRQADAARSEADKLLKKGFPAITVRKQVGNSIWYRVYVGPFKSKEEADRYTRSIAASTGNDAYTIDFATERDR